MSFDRAVLAMMPSAARVAVKADGESESMVQCSLLDTKAQWRLPLGVAQVPPLRQAARTVLAVSVALLLAWGWALVDQARSGQGDWFLVSMASLIGLPWLTMAWRSWQSLSLKQSVTLCWGGLPSSRGICALTDMPPGWSVLRDGEKAGVQAVSVHVVFDLGIWALVKMASKTPSAQAAAWSWLDARVCFKGKQGHRLRALLFNAGANQVKSEQPCAADEGLVVASSRHRQRRWFTVFSSSSSNDAMVDKKGALPQQACAPGQAVPGDADFADTVILAKTGQGADRKERS